MRKPAKDKHFIKQPWYEGGPKAMKQFIVENLRYPTPALESRIEGTVFVKYDIDHQGNVTDAKVVTGLGHGCDEEAVRLVKLLKFRVEKPRGLRVVHHKHIQIHFRLPSPPPQQMQLTYNVVTAQKKETETEQQPTGSYTFTIPL